MENYTLFSENDAVYETEVIYAYTKDDSVYLCALTQEKCGDSYGIAYSVLTEKLNTYFSCHGTEQLLAHLKSIIQNETDIKALLEILAENGIEHKLWLLN